jgi:uncharacterized membrane protein YphA (DoxX/SURF4 family)
MIENSDLILLVARLLLAMMFVVSAIDKLRLDRLEMEQIASLHLPAPALLERFTGICELLGATALVLGIYMLALRPSHWLCSLALCPYSSSGSGRLRGQPTYAPACAALLSATLP